MELRHGAPADLTGRSEREIRAYAFLDGLGVDYDRVDLPDAPADTMEGCAADERILDAPICKNLFLCNRQKTEFFLLLMPGDKPFRTKELSRQLGTSRLSFADGETMERLLDLHPGSVSVLGLMNDRERRVKLAVDRDVLAEERFGCHPCENTSSIRFSVKDLTERILPALGVRPAVVTLTGEE